MIGTGGAARWPEEAFSRDAAERRRTLMVRRGLLRIPVGLGLALCLPLALPSIAGAHERRQVGSYVMRVGWADEPTFASVKNAVQLLLGDASGKPVTDLPEDLKVEI